MRVLAICIIALLFSQSCRKNGISDIALPGELSIASIHQAYRDGTFTSEQLVMMYLDRISRYDTLINSVTIVNPEALSQARELDREFRKTGRLRRLHGIPIIVKDNINTKGLPTTAGSKALADFIPGADAFIIGKLLDEGAIILAKSNMAEWAFSPMHTESSTAGTTHNPYNTDYVPAGSSGGTAAAVASGFAVAGLGTDTGNSIRGPSSHCALVGFRPTIGLVSRSAIVPLYLRNDVAGPMCRSVEDAARLLEVMAGYDPDDEVTAHSEGKIPESYIDYLDKDGLQGARIGVLRILTDDNIDPEVNILFEKALADMESLGATIVDPVEVEDFSQLRQNQWCPVFRHDVEAYLAKYVRSDTMKTLEDIIRVGTNSAFAASRLAMFARSSSPAGGAEECSDAYTDSRRVAFRNAIERVMDSLNIDALVYPTWNHKPAHINLFEDEYRGDNSQIIAPHTGQPAFTVPMGYCEGNLPAGIQFLGRMFDEPLLIKITFAYEQGTLHRVPPELK